MKIIGVVNQAHAVTSIENSPQNSPNKEQNSTTVPYVVKDRVTLSNRAKTMSHNHVPILYDSGSSILSYEIRKPYTAPIPEITIAPFSDDK